jgi:glutaconate CoA-transferase subunit A
MDTDCAKVMTAREAISQFVSDGCWLAIGGFVTNRRPYALVHEIIRQKKRNLYIEGGPAGGDVDLLIGAGCVRAIMVSYIANSGYTQVCRRFRAAVEQGTLLFEDYSLDVQTIAYHAAALGLSYIPVQNMLGSDLEKKWGISRDVRRSDPKLPSEKFVIQEDPFHPGRKLCCVPAPTIDTALIHAQWASPDGTVRIVGAPFQDTDLALAAKHTIVSCEQLVNNEEIRRHPEYNTLTGLCVDAVVPISYGAHPSQCFGYYDYDGPFYMEYDKASQTQEGFDAFVKDYIEDCPEHNAYVNKLGAGRLFNLRVKPGMGYVPGLRRK